MNFNNQFILGKYIAQLKRYLISDDQFSKKSYFKTEEIYMASLLVTKLFESVNQIALMVESSNSLNDIMNYVKSLFSRLVLLKTIMHDAMFQSGILNEIIRTSEMNSESLVHKTDATISYDFGNRLKGYSTEFQYATIINSGNMPFDFTINDNEIETSNIFTAKASNLNIAPNCSSIISVIFRANDVGSKSKCFSILSKHAEYAIFQVKGQISVPELVTSTNLLQFGNILKGFTASNSFTLNNSGDYPCNYFILPDVLNDSNNVDFVFDTTCGEILPRQSITINCIFSPNLVGEFEKSFSIKGDSSLGTIKLKCTGLGGSLKVLVLGDGNKPLRDIEFGSVLNGSQNVEDFYLQNSGTTDVTLLLNYDRNFLSLSANWSCENGIFCEAGKTEKISILYCPTKSEEMETQLKITMNGEEFFKNTLRGFSGALG